MFSEGKVYSESTASVKRIFGAGLFIVLTAGFAFAEVNGKRNDEVTFEPFTVKLYDGSEVQAEKGKIKVPENRKNRDSRLITVAFVRVKSTSENPGTPLIYLAGGPGGSGTAAARFPYLMRYREVADLIFIDQRGTGMSSPRPLYRSKQPFPEDGFVNEQTALNRMMSQRKEAYEELIKQGFDLLGYNTQESADDINDLRKALGYEKVSLLGFSYGTHLGLITIRRHGDYLDKVVLVGTEGPNHTLKYPSTYQAQMIKLSAYAARDDDVNSFAPDMLALAERVLKKLAEDPVTVKIKPRGSDEEIPVKVGEFGLRLILRLDIGDGNDTPVFPALLHTIDQGDLDLLTWFVQKRYFMLASGFVNGMSMMMDAYSGISGPRLARVNDELDSCFLGMMVNLGEPDAYAAVGNPDLGNDYRKPIHSNVETLFISGTLDSNTPPFNTEEVRWGFPFSYHIIVDHAGHEDMWPKVEVQEEIIRFLKSGTISGKRISHKIPDFLSVADAKRNRGIVK